MLYASDCYASPFINASVYPVHVYRETLAEAETQQKGTFLILVLRPVFTLAT